MKFKFVFYFVLFGGLFLSSFGCDPYILSGKTCDEKNPCEDVRLKCDLEQRVCVCAFNNDCDCPSGEKYCGQECVDTKTNKLHCNDCGKACGDGELCCDGGCTKSDESNCGACNKKCEKSQGCCGGSCKDFLNDKNNCGACGVVCGGDESCCNGKCINLTSNNQNCGACGNKCDDFKSTCKESKCVCSSGGFFCNRTCLPKGENCVEKIAGTGKHGFADGEALGAQLASPSDLDFGVDDHSIYIAAEGSNSIRKLTPMKKGTMCHNKAMSKDGYCLTTIIPQGKVDSPKDLHWDGNSKTLYVLDTDRHNIMAYNKNGSFKVIAGSGVRGLSDNTEGQKAQFHYPQGITFNAKDKILYTVSAHNNIVRTVRFLKKGEDCQLLDAQKKATYTKMKKDDYCVTTIAGSVNAESGFKDGVAYQAQFNEPHRLVFNTNNRNIYVSDTNNHSIRKLTFLTKGKECRYPKGSTIKTEIMKEDGYCVTTVAGNGKPGFKDGLGKEARFRSPYGLVFDTHQKILYIADTGNNRIRKMDLNGLVSTLAGSGVQAFKDGTAKESQFHYPKGLAFGAAHQTLYVADSDNHIIRTIRLYCPSDEVFCKGTCQKLNFVSDPDHCGGCGLQCPPDSTECQRGTCTCPNGRIFCQSGDTKGFKGVCLPKGVACVSTISGGSYGFRDGVAKEALFKSPVGLSLDANENALYIADSSNDRIRKLHLVNKVTTIAGSAKKSFKDGAHSHAQFYLPFGVQMDVNKKILYIADTYNNRLRKLNFDTGMVSTVYQFHRDSHPTGMALDTTGRTLYISCTKSNQLFSFDLEKGAIKDLKLQNIIKPRGLAWNKTKKTLYIATEGGNQILAFDGNKVIPIAGSGAQGSKDGKAGEAQFNNLRGLALDPNAKNLVLYIADSGNHKIRKLSYLNNGNCGNDSSYTGYCVTTIAGTKSVGDKDGEALTAQFNHPYGLAIDPKKNFLFVSEYTGHKIRKIQLPPTL